MNDLVVRAVEQSLGHPLEPEWADAFRAVPRGTFVPRFVVQNAAHAWELVQRSSPRWSELVHNDIPLITQLDGDDTRAAEAARVPLKRGSASSSSSQPSLMALMLAALDVHDGHRVLEIGTGSGYNTGLLCHRLGADAVTTIDIDPGVTAAARARLVELGLHPTVVTGDGSHGHPDNAPYDRVIATVGLPEVPMEWLDQCVDGAVLVVPLDRRNNGGLLARLTVRDGGASGAFLPDYGGFMPVRSLGIGRDAAGEAFRTVGNDDGSVTRTDRPAEIGTSGPGEFFVALRTGGIDQLGFRPSDGGPPETWLADGTGSWACHRTLADGAFEVRQEGGLWDRIVTAHDEWESLGRPPRERFRLTVTADGTHRIDHEACQVHRRFVAGVWSGAGGPGS